MSGGWTCGSPAAAEHLAPVGQVDGDFPRVGDSASCSAVLLLGSGTGHCGLGPAAGHWMRWAPPGCFDFSLVWNRKLSVWSVSDWPRSFSSFVLPLTRNRAASSRYRGV